MRIRRTVTTRLSIEKAFDYLSDFTNTTLWDPATVVTVRVNGNGPVGVEYLNTSTFAGRQTQLRYVVKEYIHGHRISLRGENKTVVAVDTITFRQLDQGTEITYTADFTFKGYAKLLVPFLGPAFKKLGDGAAEGMKKALDGL